MAQTIVKSPRLQDEGDVCATSTSGIVIVITDIYKVVNEFQNRGVIEHNDCLLNLFEEFSFEDTLEVLESLKMEGNEDITFLQIRSSKVVKEFMLIKKSKLIWSKRQWSIRLSRQQSYFLKILIG